MRPIRLTYQNRRSPRPPEVTAAAAVLLGTAATALVTACFTTYDVAIMLLGAAMTSGVTAWCLLKRSDRTRGYILMLAVITGFLLPVILACFLVPDLTLKNMRRLMTSRMAIGSAIWGIAATLFVLLTREPARRWFVDEEYAATDEDEPA